MDEKRIADRVAREVVKKAKFLIPISPSAIEGHELKLIEREVDEIIQLEGLPTRICNFIF